ncbi:MAG: NifU family protein [Gemmataceae bacterium]|nr:NifU family protein [Gemmataceae bacterium]
MSDESVFQDTLQRLEILLKAAQELTDAQAKECTRELVQTLLDFHRLGLARVLEIIARAGDPGRAIITELAEDELASTLLLQHDLHPVDVATRVRRALDMVRPYMHANSGDVELLAATDEVVQVRAQGSGWTTSAIKLKLAVQLAILRAVPGVTTIEIQGLTDDGNGLPPGRMPLPIIELEKAIRKCHELDVREEDR